MQSLLFIVLVCFCFRYSNGNCNGNRDCVSCTTSTTWPLFGHSCRWCPHTSSCHAYGSAVLNKCLREENVLNPQDCDDKVYRKYDYDKNLAFKMIWLCALAYSNDVAKYIPRASEVNTFQLVKQVTNPCSRNALCSGFVAVSHVENAIAIAFRGTELSEIYTQLMTSSTLLLKQRYFAQGGGKVSKYFLDAFDIVWDDLQEHVYDEMKKYPSYKVWVTGHSLGGALASLASTVISFKGDDLMLYTFGQPRVGNYKYASTHDSSVPKSFRVTHHRDIVAHLPMCKDQPCSRSGKFYHHGIEIYYGREIMTKYSSYKVCEGLPYNEDVNCSNSAWPDCYPVNQFSSCIDDHKQYFGISVATWWENQVPVNCVPYGVWKLQDDCWYTTSAPKSNTTLSTTAGTGGGTEFPFYARVIFMILFFAAIMGVCACLWWCWNKFCDC